MIGDRASLKEFFRRQDKKLGSGLDFLLDLSKDPREITRERAIEFVLHAAAVEETFAPFAQDAILPAWVAFCLLRWFDPGVLSLNLPGRLQHAQEMALAAREQGSALLMFCIDLDGLRKSIVADPALLARLPPALDPIEVSVEREWFSAWLARHGIGPHPFSRSHPVTVMVTDPPSDLRRLLEVNEWLYGPAGPFDRTNPWPIEVTQQALEERGLPSTRLVEAGVTFLARKGQGRGRKRKPRP
jgi:hypothetical protein